MKKLLCLVLCLFLCSCCLAEEAPEAAPEDTTPGYLVEDEASGIGYRLSERWQGVEVSEENAAEGVCAMYTAEDGSLLIISLSEALDEDGEPVTDPGTLAALYQSAGLETALRENGVVTVALPEQEAVMGVILNGRGLAMAFAVRTAGETEAEEAAETLFGSLTVLPEEEAEPAQ